jgi:hypothetical protein
MTTPFIIKQWINGYSNCGTKIKTAAIKKQVNWLNNNTSQYYELIRNNGLWFIAEVKDKRTCQ